MDRPTTLSIMPTESGKASVRILQVLDELECRTAAEVAVAIARFASKYPGVAIARAEVNQSGGAVAPGVRNDAPPDADDGDDGDDADDGDSSRAPRSTPFMIRLARENPGRWMTAEEVVAECERLGWVNPSDRKVTTLRRAAERAVMRSQPWIQTRGDARSREFWLGTNPPPPPAPERPFGDY